MSLGGIAIAIAHRVNEMAADPQRYLKSRLTGLSDEAAIQEMDSAWMRSAAHHKVHSAVDQVKS
jgi:hypothetical protein